MAEVLARWQLDQHYQHMYVATGNLTEDKARALLGAGRFETVASEATVCRRVPGGEGVSCSRVEVGGEA